MATSVQVARDLNAIRAKRNDADSDLIRFAAGDAAVVAALYVSLVSKMKALTSQKAQDALAKTWRSMSSEPPRRS
ncbi:MAG: hypothetical protein HMLKMBBP_03237 [Planctomycetes bacterium]|nr:hypothetical protein [Planctomycetota bacterium]